MRQREQSLWFLGPFRTDEWLLHEQISPSAEHGRALTRGGCSTRAAPGCRARAGGDSCASTGRGA
ncbi:hypothetical protein ACFYNL_36400 [Streptomyces sp. NPDC007808]|uniref:hypothetical protein n=1 Tax=Streptomyces sp. NPDC007808 TaxID=3364779 RepID=UPI0036987862